MIRGKERVIDLVVGEVIGGERVVDQTGKRARRNKRDDVDDEIDEMPYQGARRMGTLVFVFCTYGFVLFPESRESFFIYFKT